MGRSTGATVGVLHGTHVIAREYAYPERKLMVQSLEQVVFPAAHTAFATFGDSGALVYSARGAGLGMVWGGMKEEYSGSGQADPPKGLDMRHACFYTPLGAIMESLSAAAGEDSSLSWVA